MEWNSLEKLASIKIAPDNRITEADRKFCEANEKAYHHAAESLTDLKKQWNHLQAEQEKMLQEAGSDERRLISFIRVNGLEDADFRKATKRLHAAFVERLVDYFNATYHVWIDASSIREFLLSQKSEENRGKQGTGGSQTSENGFLLSYTDVLEQILLRLDGRTFAERALAELKEKCHHAAWNSRDKKPGFVLKNDTIRFDDGTSYRSGYRYERWELTDELKNILRGAAHFETGQFGKYPPSFVELPGWSNEENPVVFRDCEKVRQLRMYKNCRTDLQFTSREYAEQFVAEYLGRAY